MKYGKIRSKAPKHITKHYLAESFRRSQSLSSKVKSKENPRVRLGTNRVTFSHVLEFAVKPKGKWL